MRPSRRREGLSAAAAARTKSQETFNSPVFPVDLLSQGWHTNRLRFERMQRMAENTTQRCHRLAATQPARPTLAYPSPRNPFAAGVDKWWAPQTVSSGHQLPFTENCWADSWLASTGAEVMIGWDAVNRDIATTSGSGYSCASPAEGLSDL